MVMKITHRWPWSRAQLVNCKHDRMSHGSMKEDGTLILPRPDGESVEFLKVSCDYCGHTMLFDPAIPRRAPYRGDGTEELPS